MTPLEQRADLKRKRTEEPLVIKHEQRSMDDTCHFEMPKLFRRDTVPLYKKALALYPASTTLENSIYPAPKVASLESFYNHIQPNVSDQRLENYSTPRIAATLSPFQLQNVEWMISREGHTANTNGGIEPDLSIYTSLPLLYAGAHETEQTGTYIDMITTRTSTNRANISNLIQLSYSGGILSDEMGLGKTVSVLNLIAKHTYSPHDPSHPKAEDVGNLTFAKGTLIVAPGTIISQWHSEIKKHAPELTVFIYEGRRYQKETTAEDLAKYDIVLAYYEAFRQEIHYSQPPPKRPQRNGVAYNREFNLSPLVSAFWFRCILDEAQMIEGQVSIVAKVAKKIPRWYAWAVTGTPMRRDLEDLYGLYDFIAVVPSIKTPATFSKLCKDPQFMPVFFDFARNTIRRNTKRALESQLHIPKQSRHVVRFPFTTIEQHYYDDLWKECKQSIELDSLDSNNWNMYPETREVARSRMRSWLVALRQSCIHPSLIANASLRLRTSRTNTNSIQTMTEVLQDMAKSAKINLDQNQYSFYQLKLQKAGMYEVMKDLEKAMETYTENVPAVEALLEARCEDSRQYHAKAKELEKAGLSIGDTLDVTESKVHIKWQMLVHRYYFYMASAYHTLENEERENEFYAKAGDIRRDLLESYTERVDTHTNEMRRAAKFIKDSPEYHYGIRHFVLDMSGPGELADMEDDDSKQEGLNVLENVKGVGHTLDQQLAKILYLRKKIMPILTKSLVDADKNAEATGEEYDNSLEEQALCQIYLSAYKGLLQDRRFIINGNTVTLDTIALDLDDATEAKEDKTQSDTARKAEAAEKAFRSQLMSPANYKVECLRDVEVQLRDVKRNFKINKRINIPILNEEQAHIRAQLPIQTKLVEHLDNDLKKLTQLFNSRIAYYKYLQTISDTLLAWQSEHPRAEMAKIDAETEQLADTITHSKSRDMYFKSLMEEQDALQRNQEGKPKDCLICRDPIEKGMITYCGHSSCYSCGVQWFKTSRRCHTCNATVKPFEWYRVSYQEMEMHDRDQVVGADSANNSSTAASINGNENALTVPWKPKKDERIEHLIREIKKQQISSSQGAKIDSIIRHIKYVKEKDNGKCVVFSQWTKVLAMLKTGLEANGIQCTNIDTGAGSAASKNKVARFQQDPDMNVILLHARSQSSGLTLVAAHTAFIVEPVLNESLEKQAINRIHRIGQTEETSVFWYIVQDTIEERIHAIHDIKRIHNQKNNPATNDNEKTQMSKVSEGGGEYVNDDDLRRCFTSNLTYALRK
ncbi:glucosidase II [Mucor velutinosus]|uniref:Glucosidase II n=1 Tax=Mucor velutinosus TaxID=708070 RepID=A0AAN7DHU4_9FUNG|nr:glucosidase II [Mucor velutinosus]